MCMRQSVCVIVAPAVIDMGEPLLRTSIAPFVTPFDYLKAQVRYCRLEYRQFM